MKAAGLLSRLLACLALVAATWNPTGVSYADWIGGPEPLALQAAVTALLLALHILFARITWLSLGPFGLGFSLAILLAGVFTLSEFNIINLNQPKAWGYVSVSIASIILTTGLVWSLFKRRFTGQSNYLNPPP